MFDEEPDGDVHGECAVEISTLQALLTEARGAVLDGQRYGAGNWSGLVSRIDAALQGGGEQQAVWRCFHCEEVFTSSDAARLHFGPTEHSTPACQIDAAALRDLEETLRRYREEDTDLHRALHAKDCQHATALRRAEEQGYATGLADAAGEVRELIEAIDAVGKDWTPPKSERLERALRRAREVALAGSMPSRVREIPADVRERMVRLILEPLSVPSTGEVSMDMLDEAIIAVWKDAVSSSKNMNDAAALLRFAHALIGACVSVLGKSMGATAR